MQGVNIFNDYMKVFLDFLITCIWTVSILYEPASCVEWCCVCDIISVCNEWMIGI